MNNPFKAYRLAKEGAAAQNRRLVKMADFYMLLADGYDERTRYSKAVKYRNKAFATIERAQEVTSTSAILFNAFQLTFKKGK